MDAINSCSNYIIAMQRAEVYLGNHTYLFLSTIPGKKYMVYDPNKQKMIHFGNIKVIDFTKHCNQRKRDKFLRYVYKKYGQCNLNKYSPLNLTINILY